MRNFGLIIPKIETREQGAEHILGSIRKFRGQVINPPRDWSGFLPAGELQSKQKESNGCTVFGSHNAEESLLKFLGHEENWSDPYGIIFATLAGVLNPSVGADPHQILELLRNKSGRLAESLLPFKDDFDSSKKPENWDNLVAQAKQFYNTWETAHEWVFNGGSPQSKKAALKEALGRGPVCVSVLAWEFDGQVYRKDVGAQDGHWVMLVKYDEQDRPVIFDSYADGEGDPFLKTLDSLYDFNIAKVIYISPAQPRLSILQKILNAIAALIPLFKKQVDAVAPIKPEVIEQPKAKPQSRISSWAEAIKYEEGWFANSRSYRNRNPGNLKYTSLTASLGATGKDSGNFCIFPPKN